MFERIRELYWAKPFLPFTIYVADGRTVTVSHPEFMALGPNGHTITVYEADGPLHILNLDLITDVTVKPERAASK